MNNFLEALKEFGGYAGAGAAIIGFVALVVKPIREKIILWIKGTVESDEVAAKMDRLMEMVENQGAEISAISQELHKQSDNQLSTSRNTILMLTQKYKEKGSIPVRDLENIIHLADSYFALGGNSFVEACLAEIKQLPIEY